MTNIAVVVGNTDYQNLGRLECCREDVIAVKEILDATEKFDAIELVENAKAADLKDRIRSFVDKHQSVDEVFFYFTGHGFQHESEFYFCATNFDSKRPNETGLSNSDLHTILKAVNPELIVKVVDACSSGALLLKTDNGFLAIPKQGIKNLIQIASCLDSQSSLTGHPLSLFTEKFRTAVLRKPEGQVYYSDVINTLRDEFLENNAQTPHFVLQCTGREQFVDDAKRFENLRAKLRAALAQLAVQGSLAEQALEAEMSLTNLLEAAETKIAKKDVAQKFIGDFFEKLKNRLSVDEFAEFFDLTVVEHATLVESTTWDFIVRILANETRPDNFVTAKITRTRKPRSAWEMASLGLSSFAPVSESDYNTAYDLDLNCSLERVQLRVTLTPKYSSLKRIILVVTCAPSLEICYVFELATQHALRDWVEYDPEGIEITRRWYKMAWADGTDGLVDKISQKLREVVLQHLEGIKKRLIKE